MVARSLFALAIAILLSSSSGCCLVRRVFCDECCSPCDTGAFTYYAGRSCGEQYCGDWHSHPPKCDPCDRCGNYVGACECGGVRPRIARPAPVRAMMTVGADCGCGAH
jgi:hypothetical protein